jgi:rhomboid family GlyGly-CTERM serine protease
MPRRSANRRGRKVKTMMRRFETTFFVIILILLNLPLLTGGFSDSLIYIPQQVTQGQLFRLITHPFVHISLYHLILDGAAFILLYTQLNETSFAKRLIYLLGIHTAVTVGVTLALPDIAAAGYCGISGIAHGLMAIWCLERMTVKTLSPEQKTEGRVAAIVLIGLVVKCLYEVASGHVFFESMHLGNVGIPVVASHLWGVAGAIIVFAVNHIQTISSCCFGRRVLTESAGKGVIS